MSRFAQPSRQTAVDHGVLTIVQADTRMLVDERLNTGEVSVSPIKFAIGNIYPSA
jgi:hypothetical protein